MLLIECSKVKKYFGDRLILDIDDLKVYAADRIGIVGINGVGKTTLINILSQRLEPDEGWVKLYGKAGYISQLEPPDSKSISSEMASKFGIKTTWDEQMSGGEKTRFKLAEALDNQNILIFADEPTSNVDMEGIELIEEKFGEYQGALVIISHDRRLLDKLCTQIIEIENSKIKVYRGNYSDYREQKLQERARAQFEYEEYVKEKKRLELVIYKTKEKVKSMRKTPKRMGNSEARLHKMGPQKAKANLERAVKNVEKRIAHLEVKEKPKEQPDIKLDIMDSNRLHTKIIIEGENINKAFGDKIIFKNAAFEVYNGAKVALIGPNGCGKSTLIKMIMDNDDAIKTATPNIDGKKIVEYKGIAFGEVITGINFVKDLAAGLTNFFGGRSGSYEGELIKAREEALRELEKRAEMLGGNAVVGVDIDYEVLGQGGMLMVTASGTVVRVENL